MKLWNQFGDFCRIAEVRLRRQRAPRKSIWSGLMGRCLGNSGYRSAKCSLADISYSTNGKFLQPWLCSAFLVTILRFLHPAAPGYDLGLQLEAAQNLLAGNGLSYYRPM